MSGTGQTFEIEDNGYPALEAGPPASAAPARAPVGPLTVRDGEPKPWRICFCCPNSFDEPSETHIYRDYNARKSRNRLCFGCTDLFFLLAFLAFWGVVAAVIFGAKSAGGNPDYIIRGVDYQGRICGVSEGVEDLKYAAWPDPMSFGFKVCVEDCVATEYDIQPGTGEDYFQYGTYVSTKFLHYCLPSVNGTVKVELTGDFDSAAETASRAIGDLWTAWLAILISAFVALICSFMYSFLTKRFAGAVVYTTLVFLVAGGFLCGYVLLSKASDYEKTDVTLRARALKGIGWTLVVSAAILLFIVIGLWSKIKTAVHVVKNASHAILDMPMIIFFPLVPFAFAVMYMAFWIVGALYIFGVKKETEEPVPSSLEDRGFLGGATSYVDLDWDEGYRASFAIHLFSLLWNMQFAVYFTYLVIAGAIANWYFTELVGDSNKKKRGNGPLELPNWPVLSSLARTLRFHLGTVALGALIIAVINMVRIVVRYIEEKIRGANPNPIQRAVFCLIQCVLACAKYCMDKISKAAFVWTAIFGSSFATGACSSFALIWANLARVIAVTLVGSYLMLLGKIMIAFATTGIMLIIITGMYEDDELNSPVMPCVVIFILAWVVAELFMLVYETVVDTIFLCFLVDERYNDGSRIYNRRGFGQIIPAEDMKRMEDEARLRKAKFHQPYDQDLYQLPADVKAD